MTQSAGSSTTEPEHNEKSLADALAVLLDVIEDGHKPYEHRAYIPGAYDLALAECKAQLTYFEQRQAADQKR